MPAKPCDAVSGGMIGMEWKRARLTRVSDLKPVGVDGMVSALLTWFYRRLHPRLMPYYPLLWLNCAMEVSLSTTSKVRLDNSESCRRSLVRSTGIVMMIFSGH